MRKLFLIAAAVLAFPSRGHASEPPLFDSAPLGDEELEQARGGFTLPGGIEIAFGATITTTVGNDVALQTMMTVADDGRPHYSYSGGQVNGQPVVVNIEGGGPSNGTSGEAIGPAGTNVTLDVETANLFIRHMVGNSVAALVANTADNQEIVNNVAINLKLDNVPPLSIGSVGFQIEGMAADAASFRAP